MSKKKNMATRLWLTLFLVLATFSVSHADYIIGNVPERIQEHSKWCWDASSQSMLYYYDHFPTQCAIANWAFSRSDCCGSHPFSWNHPCNKGNYLCYGRGVDDILDHFGAVKSYCYNNYLAQSTVQYEANAHRPFGMRFDWYGGGAHILVGRGYVSGYVYYMDPWPGNGYTVSTYAYVKYSYHHHNWTRTLRVRNPGETNLISPSGTITDTTPTYRWQKVTDATWYRLYVRGPSGTTVYNKWLSSSDYTCSGSACYYTPTTVLANGTHHWWVKTYNGYYGGMYGPWSNYKSFTVGCIKPGKVTLRSPSGTIATTMPTYSWNRDGPATQYWLYVYNDTDRKRVVSRLVDESSVCSGGVCSYKPNVAVDANDNHRWWIAGRNSCGYGPWSTPLSFKSGKPGKATLIYPSGIIYTNLPTYKWGAVPSATWYRLYVYDYTTGKAVINKWYSAASSGCSSGTGTCSLKPTTTLNRGSHRWWIKAYNGLYGDWSNSLAFNVSTMTCGFNEQFNSGNATSWRRDYGTWYVRSSAWYYTAGVTNNFATSTYNATYTNADYRARLWRVGTSGYSNALIVRASGAISNGLPANGYRFQYTSNGYYSVWKRVNGVYSAVKYWTRSSYIKQGSAWNELRAYVSGNYLWFGINGHKLWSGYDRSLTSGRAGLVLYKGSGGPLYVDWARLTCLSGTAGEEDMGNLPQISAEQQALNEAADANPIGDETGAGAQ